MSYRALRVRVAAAERALATQLDETRSRWHTLRDDTRRTATPLRIVVAGFASGLLVGFTAPLAKLGASPRLVQFVTQLANLQNLEMAYQTKEKEYQIASLQMEQQVTLAHRNLVYVLALLALLAVLVVLFQVNAKLKNSRQTLQRYHQDLKLYADMLLAKNTQLLELENNMPQNNGFKPSNSNGKEAFDPEEDQPIGESEPFYNSRILTPGDWEIFRQRFENAYPGYLLRLRTKEPNLSGAEERLFLLIKLGFNTQEIAFILGISTNGVKKGRQRLRKKLDLQVEEDLDRFILEY